ncbi:MAG: hypothetical protein WBD33_10275, partial [Xanthobacteraceae bacterium]
LRGRNRFDWRFFDRARGDPGDHDGRADHVGGSLFALGPLGVRLFSVRVEASHGRYYYLVPDIREGGADRHHHRNEYSQYLGFFAYHAMSSLQKNPQVDSIRRMDRERAFLRGDDVTTVTQCRIDRLALVRYVI